MIPNRWPTTFLIIIFSGLVAISFTYEPKKDFNAGKINTIIIDAGHGFKGSFDARDGAMGENATEDEISFNVSKKVVAEILKQMPDVQVLESRPTPFFVSIHCNFAPKIREVVREGTKTETYYVKSGKGKKGKRIKKTRKVPVYKTYFHPNPANGTETYVFAAHKTEDKEEIIMENGDIFQNEKDDETLNINLNDPVVKQQVALWTKQFFAGSVKLATMVEEEFLTIGRQSRGVKQRQKGIWVLQATAMPSILIELGFLSHRPEEEFLISEQGQQTMAESITRAIKRYKELVEKNNQNKNGSSNK
jgi:N-acetylmuramoyl-L-alanine amidase